MNAMILITLSLLAGTGAIPISPMSHQLSQMSSFAEQGIEEPGLGDYSHITISFEYSDFNNDFNISKTSEDWVVIDGEVLLEVTWHATSKCNVQLLCNPPRYPETTHIVWKERFGVVDGEIKLIETIIGEFVPTEESFISWPE